MEYNTGSIERDICGCSRRRIAGRSPVRFCSAGMTIAQTSMPAFTKAFRGGCENVLCIPRNKTRGGRAIRDSSINWRSVAFPDEDIGEAQPCIVGATLAVALLRACIVGATLAVAL